MEFQSNCGDGFEYKVETIWSHFVEEDFFSLAKKICISRDKTNFTHLFSVCIKKKKKIAHLLLGEIFFSK